MTPENELLDVHYNDGQRLGDLGTLPCLLPSGGCSQSSRRSNVSGDAPTFNISILKIDQDLLLAASETSKKYEKRKESKNDAYYLTLPCLKDRYYGGCVAEKMRMKGLLKCFL